MKELEEDKKRNFEERLKFIEFWADYVKKNPNSVWSKEQKAVIDGQVSDEV